MSLRRKVYVLSLLVISIFVSYFAWKIMKKDSNSFEINPESTTTQSTTITTKTTTRLIATGDTIGHDSLNQNARQDDGSYSYKGFIDRLKPVFQSSDIRFCNQSTLIGGSQFPITGYPLFNAPEELAKDMADLGCNVVNTASNHSSDKTQSVIDSNVSIWNGIPNILAVVGQNKNESDQKDVKTFSVDGLKYAFLAYTTYSNGNPNSSYGVNMYSREFATQQIDAAKSSGADFVIVSMRWGVEYSQAIDSFQEQESQFLADAGVSLILGHGPHVLEPVKRLQGKSGNETVVWYSLGNFLQTQLEPETLFNTIAVIDIDIETGTIVSLGQLPVYMHYEWTAEQAKNEELLKRVNLELLPVESAAELFARSQLTNVTSIQEQLTRITTVLNMFTDVKLLNLSDLTL